MAVTAGRTRLDRRAIGGPYQDRSNVRRGQAAGDGLPCRGIDVPGVDIDHTSLDDAITRVEEARAQRPRRTGHGTRKCTRVPVPVRSHRRNPRTGC